MHVCMAKFFIVMWLLLLLLLLAISSQGKRLGMMKNQGQIAVEQAMQSSSSDTVLGRPRDRSEIVIINPPSPSMINPSDQKTKRYSQKEEEEEVLLVKAMEAADQAEVEDSIAPTVSGHSPGVGHR
ncbi:hypothetical protein Dimus_017124 [Dionaea muscipula]